MAWILPRIVAASVATVVFGAAAVVVAETVGWIDGCVPELVVRGIRWSMEPSGWQQSTALIVGSLVTALAASGLAFASVQREEGAPWHRIHVSDEAPSVRLGLEVSNHAMRAIVARVALTVEGVDSVDPRVAVKRGRWRIDTRLGLTPDAAVAAVSREVSERVRRAVESQTGLPVGALRLRASLQLRRRPRLR